MQVGEEYSHLGVLMMSCEVSVMERLHCQTPFKKRPLCRERDASLKRPLPLPPLNIAILYS